jgi:DNA-binding NarL/FixJ family response regulator
MTDVELLKEISQKLSALIALQLPEDESVQDSVARLGRFGLTTSEIAAILNTTPGTVAVSKTRVKKARKR